MFSIIYLLVATLAIQYLTFLLTKDNSKQKNKPPSKDQYQIAISIPGVAIPKFFGRVKMTGYSVVFWEITRQKRIVIKEKTLWGTTKTETPNFETFVNLHAVISCAERDNTIDLKEIYCNDQLVYSNSAKGSFTGYIDKKDLFGDNDGIYGEFEYFSGGPGQVKSAAINSMYQGNASKWPRVAHIVFKNFKISNSTSAPAFSFVFESLPVPYWTTLDKVNIDGGLNPAVALYYILTDNFSGGKLSPQAIDIDKFTEAANKLKAMDFGIAYMRQTGRPLNDEISDILEVIDANYYSDALTGKLCIEINDYDYDVTTLEHIVMNDVNRYGSSVNSLTTQVSEVRVNYTDINDKFIEKLPSFKNEATRLRKGKSEVKTFNYNMITSFKVAKRVATREAIPLTNSLITLDLELSNRKISYLRVGDPVLVTLDKLDIYATPFRIMSLNLGKLKNTSIAVTLIQDRFGFYKDIISNEEHYITPNRNASAVACNLKILDAPVYFNLNQNVQDNLILTFAELPNSRQQYFELWTKSTTTDYIRNGVSTGFSFVGDIKNAMLVTDNTINISSSDFSPLNLQRDNLVNGQNLAVIIEGSKMEFINFETTSYNSTTSTYTLNTVNRGLLDSIPKSFSTSAKLYVFSYGNAVNDSDFFNNGEDVKIKALTVTSNDTLLLSAAPEIYYTSTGRQNKPINVSNLKVNTVNFKEDQTIGDVDLKLDFSYRNKIPSIQYFEEQNNSNTDLNSVVIKIYNITNTLIKTMTLSSSEITYSFTDEKDLNSGNYFNYLRVEINTLNNTLESIDKYNIIVRRI